MRNAIGEKFYEKFNPKNNSGEKKNQISIVQMQTKLNAIENQKFQHNLAINFQQTRAKKNLIFSNIFKSGGYFAIFYRYDLKFPVQKHLGGTQ